jgi:hypothetical protein
VTLGTSWGPWCVHRLCGPKDYGVSQWLEINRVSTWTFQRFSASIDIGGRYRGRTPTSRRHKT